MKKIFAILMAVCLAVSTLGVGASAADLSAFDAAALDTVLRVSALFADGTTATIHDYVDFSDGWEAAVDFARDDDYMEANDFERIVVDLLADWNANEEGEFGNGGDGFEYSTIDILGDTKMTLNLNGFTVNRGLKRSESDGEVIHISGDADVIINNGTVSGGWSDNGAGGIHIGSDARVTLNNVSIVGNTSKYDGGGIKVGKNASLTVNGGSFKNNTVYGEPGYANYYGGAVFVNGGTAIFNDVEFTGNHAPDYAFNYGAAIFAENGDVTVTDCSFAENGTIDAGYASLSIIHGVESVLRVSGSAFTGNGGLETGSGLCEFSAVFALDESELILDSCEFDGNLSYFIINDEDESSVSAANTVFSNNGSAIMRADSDTSSDSFFDSCTFENNTEPEGVVSFYKFSTDLTFYNCSMGDSTYSSTAQLRFVNDGPESVAIAAISALKTDGTTVKLKDVLSLDDGWNEAVTLALDSASMKTSGYDRIVFDMYTDWIAVDGQFTDSFIGGVGFNWDAVYVPKNVRMTVNMNGHTIDRGLTDNEASGEVIYVDEDADLIINGGADGDHIARGDAPDAKLGTVKGGFSHNGAGGIHICANAAVTLNNVCVDGNRVEDDDGSAIAVYDGAALTMNGGSIANNLVYSSQIAYSEYLGGIFVSNASASLTDVLITDNGTSGIATGAGVYLDDSRMTMKNCYVVNNAYKDESKGFGRPSSVIYVAGISSVLDVETTVFENNGCEEVRDGAVIAVNRGTAKVKNCSFLNNATAGVLSTSDGILEITACLFEGNDCRVFAGEAKTGSFFKDCTFTDNTSQEGFYTFKFGVDNELEFTNCDLGNSTSNDRTRATFNGAVGAGSIFGAGSVTVIMSILALAASCVAIFLVVYCNKKKAIPVSAEKADEE